MQHSAAPKPMLPRPPRAHYSGYIVRVVGYGRGYAFGMFGGVIHPEIGRRNGALCTHLDFPMCLSHGPGLWIYYKYQYAHVRTTLTSHVRAAARPRHVRPDDTTTHTPPHSPLHRAHHDRISAGTRSPNEGRPPGNKTRRPSFKFNVFPSTLTCRRPENRSIETRRKMTYSYGKWEQGGP